MDRIENRGVLYVYNLVSRHPPPPGMPLAHQIQGRHPQLRTNWRRIGRVQRQVLRLLTYHGALPGRELGRLIYGCALRPWHYWNIARAARRFADKRDGLWVLREG
jgi:hypothetical protein